MKTFAVRAVVVTGAYLATAAAVLAVVVFLRQRETPEVLRAVLSVYFICALAAGLEPGTVKAAVLADGKAPPGLAGVLVAGAIKGLAVAPALGLVWWLADPGVERRLLLLTPLVAVAGVWASDLRVVLDLRGRHAAAIWLKQGGLAGGLGLIAGMLAAGAPLFWSALAASAARLVPPLLMVLREPGDARPGTFLRDPRWPPMAAMSALAALGGSLDRMVALRLLPAGALAGYLVVYELFSRFWLIPYLVSPILFARLTAGRDGDELRRRSWIATGVLGGLFVALVGLLDGAAPGLPHGQAVIAFAAAIVFGALTQLRVTDMQAAGAVRSALGVTAVGVAVAAATFYVGVRAIGVDGLYWGWLAKSGVELAAALTWRPRDARA